MSDGAGGTAPLHLHTVFPPVPTAAWDAAIRHDLNGTEYETRLVWRPEPGLAVRPYYRREDLRALGLDADTVPEDPPFLRRTAAWQADSRWAPPADAIRADDWHDAGATTVQEVAFAIAAGVDRLAARPADVARVSDAAASLTFAFAVGSAFFLEVAKLRAVRLLWFHACDAFGVHGDAARMRTLVRTARANKSRYDRHTNLLRVTTEAMAAVVGGCDGLTVEACGFDPHLAANVHHVLREESHLDAVADPAGGSYYVEALTDAVAREAWTTFQGIEAAGGFGAAWDAGRIQRAIADSRAREAQAVSSRRRTLVGVNNYPNLTEPGPATEAEFPCDATSSLPAARLAEPFEALRSRAEAFARKTGRRRAVLLLKRGDVRMRMARANFCANFFGCAGFDILESEGDLQAGGDLVVLCSSDAEYLPLAREICPQASVPVLVAGNPADVEALRNAGVQGFVHMGSDAVETLGEWQRRLGIA